MRSILGDMDVCENVIAAVFMRTRAFRTEPEFKIGMRQFRPAADGAPVPGRAGALPGTDDVYLRSVLSCPFRLLCGPRSRSGSISTPESIPPPYLRRRKPAQSSFPVCQEENNEVRERSKQSYDRDDKADIARPHVKTDIRNDIIYIENDVNDAEPLDLDRDDEHQQYLHIGIGKRKRKKDGHADIIGAVGRTEGYGRPCNGAYYKIRGKSGNDADKPSANDIDVIPEIAPRSFKSGTDRKIKEKQEDRQDAERRRRYDDPGQKPPYLSAQDKKRIQRHILQRFRPDRGNEIPDRKARDDHHRQVMDRVLSDFPLEMIQKLFHISAYSVGETDLVLYLPQRLVCRIGSAFRIVTDDAVDIVLLFRKAGDLILQRREGIGYRFADR